ncbi:MAG: DUF2255 family protein [Acidimicrobiia bacterium]|nr:DUF2255 family protein [Acidimicrobiia bacterium]
MPLPPETFRKLASAKEVLIETHNGERPTKTIIWVVAAAGDLYIRSYRGDAGRWYQRALANPRVALILDDLRAEFDAVPATDPRSVDLASTAFREKYAGSGRSLDAMLEPDLLHTTMRLSPR